MLKSQTKSQRGFTLTEVLVAIMIMAIGFMAVAEMEFLALRQKQQADSGTTGTNIVQYISDYDMAEIKRLHAYNAQAYLDAQSGSTVNLAYCSGGAPANCPEDVCADPCAVCPCNPFTAITTSVANSTVSTQCSVINLKEIDSSALVFRGTVTACKADAAAMITALQTLGQPSEVAYIVRVASVERTFDVLPIVTVSLIYAVKSIQDFEETGFATAHRDTMVTQFFQVSGHRDNWATVLPAFTQVWVPHLP